MKKFLCMSAGAVAILSLASCSNEDLPAPAGEGNAIFTVQLPAELTTRAFSDGTKATALSYAVYEKGTTTPIIQSVEEVTFSDLKATVSINLANGKSYDIIWWAAVPGNSYYSFEPDFQQITVNYDGIMTNDENRDAFFQSTTIDNVQAAFTKTVQLRRPFAQINVGTDDLNEPAVTAAYGKDAASLTSSLTAHTFSNLNLLTGEVSNPTTVQFAPAGIPDGEPFPVAGYDYISMDYILVAADKDTQDMTLTINGGGANPITLDNIPVQRNYRTNIYGSMLTSPGEFIVEIVPDFDGMFNGLNGNDFIEIDFPRIDESTRTASISTPNELAGLAYLVNQGDDFEGYTFILTEDIDLRNAGWQPIGYNIRKGGDNAASLTGPVFKGTFDGGGHTVSNLSLRASADPNAQIGFFGATENADIKNITFENVDVDAADANCVGTVIGTMKGGSLSNVTVSGNVQGHNGASASATDYIWGSGGLVGAVIESGDITDCDNNARVNADTYMVGGVIGVAVYRIGESEINITNCRNTGYITGKGYMGGIVGQSNANISGCVNAGVVAGTSFSVGGIVGEQDAYGTISGCYNNADIYIKNSYGCGGIVGWVRYLGDDELFQNKEYVIVTGNTNRGNISGGNDAGGIIGSVYNFCTATDNKNYASRISAVTFAAGIVGNYQNVGTYPGMGDSFVTVTGNLSTTPADDITANNTNLFVYNNAINNPSVKATIENNVTTE